MLFLRCLSCKGELDVIGEDGIRKIVKCRNCGFTSGRGDKKMPEIVLIKKRKVIDDEVRALIIWRDARALDWWGGSLISHVLSCLEEPGPADAIPAEHLEGHRKFMSMTYNERYQTIKKVLDITDDEIRRESGGW